MLCLFVGGKGRALYAGRAVGYATCSSGGREHALFVCRWWRSCSVCWSPRRTCFIFWIAAGRVLRTALYAGGRGECTPCAVGAGGRFPRA